MQVMKEKVKFNDVVSFEDVRCLGFGVRLVSLSLFSWSADFLFGLGCLDKHLEMESVMGVEYSTICHMIKCPCKWGDFGGISPILSCDPRVFQWPYRCCCPDCHVEIHTPTKVETLKRIHLNYRLQYLKDSQALSTVPVPLGLLRCHFVNLIRILFCHGPLMMPGAQGVGGVIS